MGVYEYFSNSSDESRANLANAVLSQNSGIVIDPTSVKVSYGTFANYVNGINTPGSSIAYYDGSLGLSIGKGVLFSSGTANPASTNTSSSYSKMLTMESSSQDSDADFSTIAKKAFSGSGQVHDATWIQFDFNVSDPYNTHGITFDLLFGSDEYPEYSNSSFVDIAGVFLDGQNIALFNSNEKNPLSVIQSNIDLGYFNKNNNAYPVEYDGFSNKLTIYAPLKPGTNTLKIGVADTGDHSLDSGLYIANLKATQLGGSGLSSVVSGTDTADTITGTANSETFDLGAGDDVIDPGFGNDVILAGAGNDIIYGGKGDDQIDGGVGLDTVMYYYNKALAYLKIMDNGTIHVGQNSDTILNVESIAFADGLYTTDQLFIEDDIAKIYIAYFGRSADSEGMKYWLNNINEYTKNGLSMDYSLINILDSFAHSKEAESMYPGMNSGSLTDTGLTNFITNVYKNLFNRTPDADGLAYWLSEAKSLQSKGVTVGTIIKTVIDGALDTPTNLDRTLIQNKAQVSWDYAKQYELHNQTWTSALSTEAQNILSNITSDHTTVNDAYVKILGLFEANVTPIA